jgi:Asp-tRNA(Asn)/Glu-tRNA(Gln) amidotransferase A subunit family amidase
LPATRLVAADRCIDVAAFELMRCLEEVDAIVSPTSPQAAPAFGGPAPDNAGAFCIAANFAGCPAVSVPMGCNELGLPLGLQVIGALHCDARVLEIAASYEAAAGLDREPPTNQSASSDMIRRRLRSRSASCRTMVSTRRS